MPVETKQLHSGVTVAALSDRLVPGKEVERLESTVGLLIADGARKFAADPAALDYADSAGIGTVVSCPTRIKKSGEMRRGGGQPESGPSVPVDRRGPSDVDISRRGGSGGRVNGLGRSSCPTSAGSDERR